MAIVYKAYDTHLDSEVAVKVIRMERLSQDLIEKTLKRFEREARALAKLTHTNIVKVTDYGEFEGKPYLVMPYLPGGTLKQRMGKPIPYQEAARLLMPIAEALAYAHRQNIIHRDIKPSNILLTEAGGPMLSDFGVAKLFEMEETHELTATGSAIGTPEYMAPEQVSSRAMDGRADIYSLGIVFYEMVTGRKPYQADTPMAVMIMQARDPLPRPKQFVPQLPDEVEHVLIKALAKNPADRFQTMDQFVEALARLMGPVGQKRQGVGRDKQVSLFRNFRPQSPRTLLLLGTPIVIILSLIGLLVYKNNSNIPSSPPDQQVPPSILAPTASLISPIPPTQIPPTVVVPTFKVGLVTDTGGINDNSFNTGAWNGAQQALTIPGVQAAYLESKGQSDYAANIQKFMDEKSDLIVTVGYLLGVDTAAAAKAHPNQKFAILDYTYPDCYPGAVEGKDCGSAAALSNVVGVTFSIDQAAFLAGYLAAGMSKTGKVGTYGGLNITPITLFMKGFEAGVKYYNQKHNTSIQLLGWNTSKNEGMFTGNFTSTDDGRKFANTLVQQGADVVFAVDGRAGFGSAAFCKTTGKCLVIGVDDDWYVSAPEYKSVELTSVQKRMDVVVYNVIKSSQFGTPLTGTYIGTLANGGVDLAPFHDFESIVPTNLKAELDTINIGLQMSSISIDGVLSH